MIDLEDREAFHSQGEASSTDVCVISVPLLGSRKKYSIVGIIDDATNQEIPIDVIKNHLHITYGVPYLSLRGLVIKSRMLLPSIVSQIEKSCNTAHVYSPTKGNQCFSPAF
ncbi:hypothetical protein ACWNXI_15350 [Caldibacillus thermoamylovorans]